MLDLADGAKIIVGTVGTTAINAGGDWINTENMHCVWAICTQSAVKASSNQFIAQVAESYAGASASMPVATYWKSTNIKALDRLFKTTSSTGSLCGTTEGMVVIRYDPSVSDTSDHYFSVVTPTSGWGTSIIYICEPRYGGVNQFVATTSST